MVPELSGHNQPISMTTRQDVDNMADRLSAAYELLTGLPHPISIHRGSKKCGVSWKAQHSPHTGEEFPGFDRGFLGFTAAEAYHTLGVAARALEAVERITRPQRLTK